MRGAYARGTSVAAHLANPRFIRSQSDKFELLVTNSYVRAKPSRLSTLGERIVVEPLARYNVFMGALDTARCTIDLSLFRCDDPQVVRRLVQAKRRGVRVRVLLTNEAKGSSTQLEHLHASLEHAGIQAARYAGCCEKYHAKYMIVDRTSALITSMNLTRRNFGGTHDLVVHTPDAAVVQLLTTMFEGDWTATCAPIPDGERLIISPDTARRRFVELFERAERSVVVLDHKLDDPTMLSLLADARERGLDVQVCSSARRQGVRAHAKIIILDDRRAIVGSLGLSTRTLDRRRDLAIVIDDPSLVRHLQQHVPALDRRSTETTRERVA